MIFDDIYNYQRISTPIICIETSDCVDFLKRLSAYYSDKKIAKLQVNITYWIAYLGTINTANVDDTIPGDLLTAIKNLKTAVTPTILVVQLGTLFLNPVLQQALIDFSSSAPPYCMLIIVDHMLAIPDAIKSRSILLQDSLPTEEELSEKIDSYASRYNQDLLSIKPDLIRAFSGLNLFLCEQLLSFALLKKIQNIPEYIYEEKCKMLSKGISGLELIPKYNQTFDDLGGLDNIKEFMTSYIKHNTIDCVVWLDEIEKVMAASEGRGDNTGVSQSLLSILLTHMQENEDINGIIFYGPPGTGKSAMAKAVAGQANSLLVRMDITAMKSALVGSSEANMRRALKTLDSIAKNQLWIATCNELSTIPIALRRRFTYGIWFFDLPTAEERAKIWQYYIKKYDVPKNCTEIPDNKGWTGSEIRTCCRLAKSLGICLTDASRYIVPVSKSMSKLISSMRKDALQRYNMASIPTKETFSTMITRQIDD